MSIYYQHHHHHHHEDHHHEDHHEHYNHTGSDHHDHSEKIHIGLLILLGFLLFFVAEKLVRKFEKNDDSYEKYFLKFDKDPEKCNYKNWDLFRDDPNVELELFEGLTHKRLGKRCSNL
jgi:zinc transporter ZupT